MCDRRDLNLEPVYRIFAGLGFGLFVFLLACFWLLLVALDAFLSCFLLQKETERITIDSTTERGRNKGKRHRREVAFG